MPKSTRKSLSLPRVIQPKPLDAGPALAPGIDWRVTAQKLAGLPSLHRVATVVAWRDKVREFLRSATSTIQVGTSPTAEDYDSAADDAKKAARLLDILSLAVELRDEK